MKHHLQLCAAIVLIVMLSACASSSNRVTVQESTNISKGQELNDLLRARNESAVTEDEYEQIRKIIMRRAQ